MKKLKILVIALCAAMIGFVFAGCPKKEEAITDDTLQIAVIARGFGSEHIRELAREFRAKTGIDARVVVATPNDEFVLSSLKLGLKRNKVDLYVANHTENFKLLVQRGNVVEGSDPCWADLSEVYKSPAEGYIELEQNPELLIGDIIAEKTLRNITWTDGKQYSVPFSMGMMGLLYNKTLFDKTNDALRANKQAELVLPKTSSQMFKLFGRITALRNGSTPAAYRTNAYAYGFAGQGDYSSTIVFPWWAQYDGMDAVNNFMQGKDADGNYTPEIFKSTGRLRALENAAKLFGEGFYDTNDMSKVFTKAQLDFLMGRSFFALNGTWLENEASENFTPGTADIAFMPVPVISDIVEKFPADFTGTEAANDEKLSAVIDYLDGVAGATDQGVSADTLNFLREARKIRHQDQSENYLMFVPQYSRHVQEAKSFFRFMYSKEGQEVMMYANYGNMCPINVDYSQFDFYNGIERNGNKITVMGKTKIDLFDGATLFGPESLATPICYLTPFNAYRFDGRSLSGAFTGNVKAKDICDNDYTYYKNTWSELMKAIGQA